MAVPKGGQPALTQLAQDAIDVHRTQPQRIGEMILRQRAGIPNLAAHADESESGPEFEQKVRHAFRRTALSKADQVLDNHRLVPGCSPKNGRRQPRGPRENVQKIAGKNLGGLDVHDRLDAVVRSVKQDTAQSQKITRDLKVDDLP